MLLRIDINCNSKPTAFHACLATASNHHKDNTLLTIGRKNTDITFASERSVSRNHCVIRLISRNAKDGVENSPGTPSSGDEMEACESSADGMAVVLEDLNSKFGTSVFLDKEMDIPQQKCQSDSETDDEDVGVSMVHSQFSSTSMVPGYLKNKIKKKVQGKFILTSLSLQKDDKSGIKSLFTTIQCGNLVLNITRIPLEICHTQLKAGDKKRLGDACKKIGATITSKINNLTTKYLIAPEQRTPTFKTIYAWMHQIPVVSMSFVDASLNRNNPDDAMPNTEDYLLPEIPPMDKLQLDHPSQPLHCLEGYKVLSLQKSEGEILCRSGGSTVIKLYADEENGEVNNSFWKNNDWWNDLKEKQKVDRLVIVWLNSTSAKVRKGKDFLMKKMKNLKEVDDNEFLIRCITQMQVAKAISSLTVLEDTEGIKLLPIKCVSSREVEVSLSRSNEYIIDEGNAQDFLKQEQSVQIPQTPSSEKLKEKETLLEDNYVPSNKKKSLSQQSVTGGWMSSSQMKTKQCLTEDMRNKTIATTEIVNDNNYRGLKCPEEGLSPENERKSRLQIAECGWLVAAPQGRKRAHYRRDATMVKDGETYFPNPAETEKCSSLIVRSAKDVQLLRLTENVTFDSGKNVKNFKRFRKNSVISGSRMHSLTQIRLVPVLPKESERQRQLVESQNALERERRAADSLFAGEDGYKRGKGSIARYFRSPGKRGSGTRRRRA